MGDTDKTALDLLRAAANAAAEAERIRDEHIETARAAGHTWEQIGATLGVTGQAAGRYARRAGLVVTPPARPESRRARRRRWAAEEGARILARERGDVAWADFQFRLIFGRGLPPETYTADPNAPLPEIRWQRWPVGRPAAP